MITVQNDRGYKNTFDLKDKHILLHTQSMCTDFNCYVELTATYEDYCYIVSMFKQIPYKRSGWTGSFTWYGNIAKTILANL